MEDGREVTEDGRKGGRVLRMEGRKMEGRPPL
jgi:hypothetical protein